MSISEREENTSEGECETGGDTVTIDEDSGSEDDDYGDTEEERNEVEDVEPEGSNSTEFKEAKKKRLRCFVRHDWWSVRLHFKTLKTFVKLFCYASKLLPKTKAERNGMQSKTEAPFWIHHRTQPFVTRFDTGCY